MFELAFEVLVCTISYQEQYPLYIRVRRIRFATMLSFAYFTLSVIFGVFVVLPTCPALELQEIRPRSVHGIGSRRLAKRDFSVFDLKSTETFLWGAEGLLNYTVGLGK